MAESPDYESIIAQAKEESVRQLEDIFSNPEDRFCGTIFTFHAKDDHTGAIHPEIRNIGINHNLANILYMLTGRSGSPERGDEIVGCNNILETALAQHIVLAMYSPDHRRRIANVLKITVRTHCEEYRDHSQRLANEIHENPKPGHDHTHPEWLAQLQQRKIDFIDYLVERLEK